MGWEIMTDEDRKKLKLYPRVEGGSFILSVVDADGDIIGDLLSINDNFKKGENSIVLKQISENIAKKLNLKIGSCETVQVIDPNGVIINGNVLDSVIINNSSDNLTLKVNPKPTGI